MKTNQSGRRSFIAKATLGGLAALTIPEIAFSAISNQGSKRITLHDNDVLLFQGDSITDAGRNKNEADFNTQKALGTGYSFLAAADLLNEYPGKSLKIYNKGISGNKVYQLAERWDKDALELKPNILSILIGVNDYWHFLKNGYKGTIETYRNDYRTLLQKTKEALPDVKLIIGEPFAILGTAVNNTWFPAFTEYQNAARDLADEFDAAFIPYQKVFNKALKVAPGSYWAPDGVHPSVAGAKLMAEAWLQTVRG